MKVNLKNNEGIIKECKIGFSWTTLFFGWFVPLIRWDLRLSIMLFVTTLFSGGMANLVFAFSLNDVYIAELYKQGFRLDENDKKGEMLLIKRDIFNKLGEYNHKFSDDRLKISIICSILLGLVFVLGLIIIQFSFLGYLLNM